MNQALLAGAIFIITFILIVTERWDRTVTALLGGSVMLVLGILPQEQAFHAIDWNVIFLLFGMMMIANVLRETGIFQWIAVKAIRLGRGHPFFILLILVVVTAIASALLDNVTIIVLVVPITLFVASALKISPIPFLIAEILASNIGGAATLIGDPPNILIGSAAGFDFLTFAMNMAPVAIIILIGFLGLSWIFFRQDFRNKQKTHLDIDALDTSELITNPTLLIKALVVMGFVLLGFLIHGALHLEPATIALAGASVLVVWARSDMEHLLRDVEWKTLFFFIGLFIVVEAIVQVGIIERFGQALLNLTMGSLTTTSFLILAMSSILSGIVDNIPYTATMIPVIKSMGSTMPLEPLWWSLALGACLGGNATLVGASANIVVANLAARSGYPISFAKFFRYGFITTIFSILVAGLYVWLRYL